jgi:hypothetical protein
MEEAYPPSRCSAQGFSTNREGALFSKALSQNSSSGGDIALGRYVQRTLTGAKLVILKRVIMAKRVVFNLFVYPLEMLPYVPFLLRQSFEKVPLR